MVRYSWPENVRGVKRFVEFLVHGGILKSPDDRLTADQIEKALDILDGYRAFSPLPLPDLGLVRPPDYLGKRPLRPRDSELRNLYQKYMVDGGWSQRELADALRVHEATLSRWFNEAGIPPRPRGRRPKSARRPGLTDTAS
jgi:hypothetical protein